MVFMRAVDIRGGTGDADALFLNDRTPRPTAGPGEAIVSVRAFGLNRMDLLQREGVYPVPPQAPATLGVEFSGVVAELGALDDDDSNPDRLAVGDAVFGLTYGGAYAEYVRVSVRMLLRKPAWLAWTEAAGLPETWFTALQALHEVGEFRGRGQTALWHAGASGVGIAGIQLSRLAGAAAVYATAGSDEKCRFLTDTLGATAAFNYRTADWLAGVQGATDGAGVDLVVDFVGADYFAKNIAAAARDGHIVLLAFMSGRLLPAGIDIGPLLYKRLRIEGSALRSRDVAYQARLRDRLAVVLPRFQTGELRLFVDRVFDWTDIVAAHKYMEANLSKGKIICTVAPAEGA